MATRLGEKSLDCLTLASIPVGDAAWGETYEVLCGRYSAKAVSVKMEELTTRGYLDYGVSARTAWLTDKGQSALMESR